MLAFSALVHGEDRPRLVLLRVDNLSGSEALGWREMEATVAEEFARIAKSRPQVEPLEVKQTDKLLKEADLEAFYEAGMLCTNEELAALGRRIGVQQLALVTVTSYMAVKRQNLKLSHEIDLRLLIVQAADASVHIYEGQGINDGSREGAVANALAKALDAHLGLASSDPNAGNIRADDAPVIGNARSRLYHLQNSHHLPKAGEQVRFPSRTAAEADGYRPCPICFPDRKTADPTGEAQIGSQACGVLELLYRVHNDPDRLAHLQTVAAPLLAQALRPEIEFHFKILDTEEINAFATANGYIYLTKGMLNALEYDEELALVIGHEMAHIEKRHTILRTPSQTQETEADRQSLFYLKRAGLDYSVYRLFFGRLLDLRESRPGLMEKLFGTHPPPAKRIENLDNYLKAYETIRAGLAKA